MYTDYWGFTEKPFQNTPDPRFFYKSPAHEEAYMKLVYAVEQNLGSALLTGVFGCGKTVLAQLLWDHLPKDRYKMAFINNPQMDYIDLLRNIVRKLKAVELPVKKTELSADYLLEVLGNILENNINDGSETVIIIDEAHIISDLHIFEGLRMLLNFQTQSKFMLTLILIGQPELRKKIEDIKQLEQRIGMKCCLEAFDENGVRSYINHRLQVAGRTDPVFEEGALKVITRYSGGIPRRINRVCDLSLLNAYGAGAELVNGAMVESSLQGLAV
ncbi:ExeA family protein [Candidatus Margulisiibacteriota bacterium]